MMVVSVCMGGHFWRYPFLVHASVPCCLYKKVQGQCKSLIGGYDMGISNT